MDHGYFNKSFWLDMRGNHDNYAVPSLDSPENYYQSYAVYGNEKHYHFVLEKPFGSYQIITMDMAFQLGLSSPFSFFGISYKDLDKVKERLEDSERFNNTILAGHYPRVTSILRFPWERFTSGKKVIAYLCGHTHLDGMYKRMPEGYLELELNVWPYPSFFKCELQTIRTEQLPIWLTSIFRIWKWVS